MNNDTSLLAPSEKHLEDWLFQNFARVFSQEGRQIAYIMGRQIRTAAGIIDLLAWNGLQPIPIELKREQLTAHHLAQLLAYMGDLKLFLTAVLKIPDVPPMKGLLIGYEVSDDRLLRACIQSNVFVLLYRRSGDNYRFQDAWPKITDHQFEAGKVLIDLLLSWPGPGGEQ